MQNRYLSEIITLDSENDIEHHGVLGMKWGIRRYQPYSLIPRKSGKGGKETGAARKGKSAGKPVVSKRASTKKVSEVKKSRNQKSSEAKSLIEEKAKTARQRKEALEKIVNSGDAKAVYEHRHELSKKQLDAAIERINTEAKVASLVKQQNPSKLEKLKQFAGKVDDANSVVRTGVNTYKTVSEIKKLYTDAKKAKDALEKAEYSERVLKTIIDAGNTGADIKRLQSQLSSEDLATATKRLTNLATIDKNDHEAFKREVEAYDTSKRYNENKQSYLNKSLSDLQKAEKKNKLNASKPDSEYESYFENEVSSDSWNQEKAKKRKKNNK